MSDPTYIEILGGTITGHNLAIEVRSGRYTETAALSDVTGPGDGRNAVFLCGRSTCEFTASEAFTFTSGDETVDIGATITDFRPEAFLSMYLTGSWRPVRKRSYADLIRLYRNDTSTGYPKFIAWDSTSNALVWPDPDANYATRITYVPLLVDLGTGTNIVNIPDKFIDALLWVGAAPLVEFNNPNAAFQAPAWQRFINEIIPEARNESRVDTGFEVGIAEDDYDDADTIE